MKRKPLRITDSMVNSLQIPGDLAYQDAVITISGSTGVFIENYKSILEYEDEWILIQTKKYKIRIEGNHLQIQYYTREEMKIEGQISRISYEE